MQTQAQTTNHQTRLRIFTRWQSAKAAINLAYVLRKEIARLTRAIHREMDTRREANEARIRLQLTPMPERLNAYINRRIQKLQVERLHVERALREVANSNYTGRKEG